MQFRVLIVQFSKPLSKIKFSLNFEFKIIVLEKHLNERDVLNIFKTIYLARRFCEQIFIFGEHFEHYF